MFGLSSHEFDKTLYLFDFINFLDAAIDVSSTPINYPLNFLRDLLVFSLLSPIIGFFLSKIPIIEFYIFF